jgi:hypothetical protein
MSDIGGSANSLAAAVGRLETAIERLAEAVAVAQASPRDPALTPAECVPRAEVAALAERLEVTITRLRSAIADEFRRGDED